MSLRETFRNLRQPDPKEIGVYFGDWRDKEEKARELGIEPGIYLILRPISLRQLFRVNMAEVSGLFYDSLERQGVIPSGEDNPSPRIYLDAAHTTYVQPDYAYGFLFERYVPKDRAAWFSAHHIDPQEAQATICQALNARR